MSKFGDFLKGLRKDRGFSLRELARKLEIAPSYLSDIERGKRNAPSKELLVKMITTLALSEEEQYKFYDFAKEGKKTPIAEDVKETIIEDERITILCRKIMKKEINIDDILK